MSIHPRSTANCPRTLRCPRGVLAVGLALSLVQSLACASAKIEADDSPAFIPLRPPAEILVYEFAVRSADVSPESALGARLYDLAEREPLDQRVEAFSREVAVALADQIVSGLSDIGLSARRVSPGTAASPPPPDGVLKIEGQFVDIEAGNRLRRVVIGLGVGGSKVATEVQIFDSVATGDILVQSFSTRARSGRKPGAALSGAGGPVAAGVSLAAGAALEHRETAMADAKRTAALIVRRLAGLAYREGWVEREAALRAHAAVD